MATYYLEYDELPVYERKYISNRSALENAVLKKNEYFDQVLLTNVNDGDNYYVIDLSKLDNLTLNYGQNYLEWKNATNPNYNEAKYKDLYIINETTHQIYYPRGIMYQNRFYYSKDLDDNVVQKIENISIVDEWGVNINNIEQIQVEDNKVIVNVGITIDLTDEFLERTLEYAWSQYSTVDKKTNINFHKFAINKLENSTKGSVRLASMPIDNTIQTYYLWVKVLNRNAEEKVKIFKINIEE